MNCLLLIGLNLLVLASFAVAGPVIDRVHLDRVSTSNDDTTTETTSVIPLVDKKNDKPRDISMPEVHFNYTAPNVTMPSGNINLPETETASPQKRQDDSRRCNWELCGPDCPIGCVARGKGSVIEAKWNQVVMKVDNGGPAQTTFQRNSTTIGNGTDETSTVSSQQITETVTVVKRVADLSFNSSSLNVTGTGSDGQQNVAATEQHGSVRQPEEGAKAKKQADANEQPHVTVGPGGGGVEVVTNLGETTMAAGMETTTTVDGQTSTGAAA